MSWPSGKFDRSLGKLNQTTQTACHLQDTIFKLDYNKTNEGVPLQFFMASAPPPKRALQPRNINKSYKNTCGAPAPKGSLKQGSETVVTKLVKPKKSSRSIRTSGDLIYTIKGPKLPLGAVSDLIPLLFTLLKG